MAASANGTGRTHGWRNRITGYADVDPAELLANPKNYRRHPAEQEAALSGVIDTVGYLDPVLVQAGTNVVIDGHLRLELAKREGQASIPVAYVDLTDAEADLVLATFDPLTAMASHDAEQLTALLEAVESEDAAVSALLAALAADAAALPEDDGAEDRYTTKAESPLYEPTGERPSVAELTDTARHERLVREIEAADVPDEVRAFLRLAATRHVVFDYRRIAEFYAHAEAEVQRLMEASALVIIDLDRAIELGYARLREEMLAAVEDARNG